MPVLGGCRAVAPRPLPITLQRTAQGTQIQELHANERGSKGLEAARQVAEAELQAQCTFRPNLAKPRVQGLHTPAALSERILRKGTAKMAEESRREKLQKLQVRSRLTQQIG